jgi:8-oxo-dGTP diphosphatase
MMNYAVGFLLDQTRTKVALIRKKRPSWQAGKLNGIGGKMEAGETPAQAMAREFKEEAGVETHPSEWLPLATLSGKQFVVHCFYLCSNHVYRNAIAMTDEPLEFWDLKDPEIFDECVPSVPWLIYLTKDSNMLRGQMSVMASYVGLDGD